MSTKKLFAIRNGRVFPACPLMLEFNEGAEPDVMVFASVKGGPSRAAVDGKAPAIQHPSVD